MTNSGSDAKRPKSPYDNANIVSRYIYWWLKDLFKIGLKRQIIEDDIFECSQKHTSDKVTRHFEMLWEDEMKKSKPNLIRVATKVFWLKVMVVGFFFAIFETFCKLTNPLLLGLLIGFFTSNPHNFSNNDAYLIATGIVLTLGLPLLFFHPFMLFLFEEGMKLRIACCSLIYSKILTFTKYTMKDGIAGQAVNLMSNDVSRFDWLMSFTHDFWRPPIAAGVAAYFIYQQVEFAGLLGMAILILFMPLQGWLGRKSANVRMETAKRTDSRVKSMFSIITGIQVIKMYGWENAFARTVNNIRKFELRAIAKGYYIRATLLSLVFLTSFSVFATFVTYVLMGNSITSEKAFVTIAYFNYIRNVLVEFWPMAVTSVAEGWVSLRRVEEFLSQKVPSKSENIDLNKKNGGTQFLKNGILMKNATAYWNSNDQDNIGIISCDIEIDKKNVVCIIGQVGSGKTTLLEVILKELPLTDGELDVNGVISYAPQKAWIFEGSIRHNILFTEKYDEKRYKTVLHVCALERDLELFPEGDATIVGDRGISLSGGQKARINLARAVYKIADIYLLDDPLSAVDAHVSKHIFQKCIKDFLKDKICVLVTHQLQYLHEVDHIIVMNMGQIKTQGSYDDIKENDYAMLYVNDENFINSNERVDSPTDEEKTLDDPKIDTKEDQEENGKQTVSKETQQEGKVTTAIYIAYMKAVNSGIFVVSVALLFIIAQALQGTVDYFVSIWVTWEETYGDRDMTSIDDNLTIWDGEWWTTEKHIYLYSILIGALLLLIVSRSFAFYRMCLRVAVNLHDKLFRGVTRATMWFFNQNSTGRIINRFSKDIGTIDSMLPVVIVDCIQFFLQLATVVTIVSIINAWLLIPTLFMFIIFYGLRYVFLTTARNIKRVEAITRSPLFAHTTTSIEGLTTIRAFNAEVQSRNEFYEYQNINSSAWFLFVATSRGFVAELDWK